MKIPPYGKEIQPSSDSYIFIFMGKMAWKRAKDFKEPYFPQTLVLPPNDSPFDYAWPIKDREIYLLDTGITIPENVRQVVMCFLNSGASVIRYISRTVSMTEFKRK